MRWFIQHPKITILKQTAKKLGILPRSPKILVLELNQQEIRELDEAITQYVKELGGASTLPRIKYDGASTSHQQQSVGLPKDTTGTVIKNLSKRLRKEGHETVSIHSMKTTFHDKKLHSQLDRCQYIIILWSHLMEQYGKKYPVYLKEKETTISPDPFTTGWCWNLMHEFIHVIELENRRPIFDKDSDSNRGPEVKFGKYLPISYWNKIEPMTG